MKELFKEELKKVGFDLIGFTDDNLLPLEPYLKKAEKLGYTSPLVKGKIKERINLQSILPEALGVVVVGLTYPKDSLIINKSKLHFGNSSWGQDYHLVIKDKCELALKEIIKNYPNLQYKIITDTSNMDDRFLAYKAGLGFYGRNSLLINEKYGSYFFIGAIIININFDSQETLAISKCGDCKQCMIACPSKAINETGILDSFKCRSYLTQKKGDLNVDEKKILGTSVFGCDICARVCPYNQGFNHTKNQEFCPTGIEQLEDEIVMSNREFKGKYGHLAGAYIGKTRINRNIKYIKDKNNMV